MPRRVVALIIAGLLAVPAFVVLSHSQRADAQCRLNCATTTPSPMSSPSSEQLLPRRTITGTQTMSETFTVQTSQSIAGEVSCPTGAIALSGGAEISRQISNYLSATAPVGSPPTGWRATATINVSPAVLTVYAVCANLS